MNDPEPTETHAALALGPERPLEQPLETDGCLCCACDAALSTPTEHDLCEACEAILVVEADQLLETVGSLLSLGTPNRAEEAKQSLRVLYVSTFLGTNADRIARFLGASRTATRQYGMRFRAAKIWEGGAVKGPWARRQWLSPAFCRLFFMDALVGAGQVVRGKDRWEFLSVS